MRIGGISFLNNARINRQNNVNKINYITHPIKNDSVEFSFKSRNKVTKPLKIGYDSASKIVKNLSTATSGHRAPYMSETFTPEAVHLIALGVGEYAKENSIANTGRPTVLIGGDTRLATRESLPEIKNTLLKQGIDVLYLKDPVPTPLLAMAANRYNLGISILMTASHNPWEDGGFNFITPEGAVAPSEVTREIAKNIDNIARKGTYTEDIHPTGRTYTLNPYILYKHEIEDMGLIDFENIKDSGLKVYYDGLQGTGTYVMPRYLKEKEIPFKVVKSSGQKGPNPTEENLEKLKNEVKNASDNLKIGIANDGDADRFGIIDEKGNFIDPNDVILLTAYHLIKNKGLKGDIVRSQATSKQVDKLAEAYNLELHETPIGFKYLASDILKAREEGRDIIVAGEESGGLTVYGHIPEKDGILADLIIMDLVAKERKPLSEILNNVKEEYKTITYIDNYSKRLKDDETKQRILDKAGDKFYKSVIEESDKDFGKKHIVDSKKTLELSENIKKYRPQGDGYKFVMTDDSTVLIRKSGTEPLIRFYIEAAGENIEQAKENASSLKEYIEETFSE